MGSSVWDNDSESGGIVVPDSDQLGITSVDSVGAGESLVNEVDLLTRSLHLKSIVAGDNISITDNGTELEIDCTIETSYTIEEGATPLHYVATAGQTEFDYPNTITAVVTNTHVWVNGLKLTRTTDYTVDADNFKIVLEVACGGGEAVEVLISGSFLVDIGVLGQFSADVAATAAAAQAAEDSADAAAASVVDAAAVVESGFSAVTATATTLSVGSSATAAFNTGTKVLTLGIPTGATGATGSTGATGPGFTFQGDYDALVAYVPGDVVRFTGYLYLNILASTGNLPTNETYWEVYLTGLDYVGNFSNAVTYYPGDTVRVEGSEGGCYVATAVNPPGELSEGYWGIIAADGVDGATGATGSILANGDYGDISCSGGVLTVDNYTHNHDATYAPIAKGVTNGDSHDHNGGDGAQIAYSGLSGLPTLGTMAAESATTYAKKSADADVDMNNYKISEIKTASFNTEVSASGTSGAVTCAFANGQKMKVVPTGAVTSFALSFPGVGHYQLRIAMGTSYAITWTFSGVTAYQIDAAAPTTAASKSTFVNFFYDGTNCFYSRSQQA